MKKGGGSPKVENFHESRPSLSWKMAIGGGEFRFPKEENNQRKELRKKNV